MRPSSFLTATASVAAAMLLTLGSSVARAQATAALQGHVRSARTGEAVRGATVLIVGTRNGTLTDSAGAYSIGDVLPGSIKVSVRAFGYAPSDSSLEISG